MSHVLLEGGNIRVTYVMRNDRAYITTLIQGFESLNIVPLEFMKKIIANEEKVAFEGLCHNLADELVSHAHEDWKQFDDDFQEVDAGAAIYTAYERFMKQYHIHMEDELFDRLMDSKIIKGAIEEMNAVISEHIKQYGSGRIEVI